VTRHRLLFREESCSPLARQVRGALTPRPRLEDVRSSPAIVTVTTERYRGRLRGPRQRNWFRVGRRAELTFSWPGESNSCLNLSPSFWPLTGRFAQIKQDAMQNRDSRRNIPKRNAAGESLICCWHLGPRRRAHFNSAPAGSIDPWQRRRAAGRCAPISLDQTRPCMAADQNKNYRHAHLHLASRPSMQRPHWSPECHPRAGCRPRQTAFPLLRPPTRLSSSVFS